MVQPRLLAASIGHLPATQFLYVRGASPHVVGGQPPLLPVEAAARPGFNTAVLRFVGIWLDAFGRFLSLSWLVVWNIF